MRKVNSLFISELRGLGSASWPASQWLQDFEIVDDLFFGCMIYLSFCET